MGAWGCQGGLQMKQEMENLVSLGVGGSSEEPSICSRNGSEGSKAFGKGGGGCWRALWHLFSLCLPAQKLHPHPSECSYGPRPARKAQAQNVTAWTGGAVRLQSGDMREQGSGIRLGGRTDRALPGWLSSKNPSASAADAGSIPELGRSRILAWENPMTEEPGGPQAWVRKELDTTERRNNSYQTGRLWRRLWRLQLLESRPLGRRRLRIGSGPQHPSPLSSIPHGRKTSPSPHLGNWPLSQARTVMARQPLWTCPLPEQQL